jgi:hypothetical protein
MGGHCSLKADTYSDPTVPYRLVSFERELGDRWNFPSKVLERSVAIERKNVKFRFFGLVTILADFDIPDNLLNLVGAQIP